jgi:O-acetylserine/cysteine efflux transporter
MPLRHVLLAVAVAATWGLNFVIIDVGLQEVPPLLLCALALMVWISLVPPLPLLGLSLIVDGPHAVGHALAHLDLSRSARSSTSPRARRSAASRRGRG